METTFLRTNQTDIRIWRPTLLVHARTWIGRLIKSDCLTVQDEASKKKSFALHLYEQQTSQWAKSPKKQSVGEC